MKIILVNEENLMTVQQSSNANVMALGFFDGVHRGHQHVISQAKLAAEKRNLPLAVMSFFPHPKTVFSDVEVDYLMPMEQKAQQLKKLGVDFFYIVDFTKTFASLSPESFIEQYLVEFRVHHTVVGFDYTYGFKGAGTVETIEQHSRFKLTVEVAKECALYGSKISSTCLRQLLKKGQVETMTVLLGRAYAVDYHIKNGVKPYFTLPCAGDYYVTALSKGHAISQKVSILTDGSLIFNHAVYTEECTIVFHEQIQEQALKMSS